MRRMARAGEWDEMEGTCGAAILGTAGSNEDCACLPVCLPGFMQMLSDRCVNTCLRAWHMACMHMRMCTPTFVSAFMHTFIRIHVYARVRGARGV